MPSLPVKGELTTTASFHQGVFDCVLDFLGRQLGAQQADQLRAGDVPLLCQIHTGKGSSSTLQPLIPAAEEEEEEDLHLEPAN